MPSRKATPEETRAWLGKGLIVPVPQPQISEEELQKRIAAFKSKVTVAGLDDSIYQSGLSMTSVRVSKPSEPAARPPPSDAALKR